MRDHLATLNEIIGDAADGKLDDAAKLSEQRLGNEFTQPPWCGSHGTLHAKADARDWDQHASRRQSVGPRAPGHFRVAIARHNARCQPGSPRSHHSLRSLPRELSNSLSIALQ
jgi:hypothetical protein